MEQVLLSELSFDELNRLVGYHVSEPFEDYFKVMDINRARMQKRIDTAKYLNEVFEELLIYMFEMKKAGILDYQEAYATAVAGYINAVRHSIIPDDYIMGHADAIVLAVLETLYRHSDEPYYYSRDRARAIAESESATIWNYSEFEEALEGEYRYKTWVTMADNRVRDTHTEMEGVTIPINDIFHLDGGDCYFPRDDSLGMDSSEIVNCRCTLDFS